MLRRFACPLLLLPLAAHAPPAHAGWIDDGSLTTAIPSASVDDDESLRSGLAGNGVQVFSRRLGGGYRPARGVHAVPYLEVESRSWDTMTLGWLDPAQSPSSGHFLIGARASYALAPLWTLSFDMAAGKPLLPEQFDHPHLSAREEEEEGDVAWRTGIRLGYALGRNFSAFSIIETGDLKGGPTAAERLLQPDIKAAETSVRIGFTYRFH